MADADLQARALDTDEKAPVVVIAGASGMIGRALTAHLMAGGFRVRRLVRRPAFAADEISWDPNGGELDPAALDRVHAVVNLAGENVAAGRWNAARRKAILSSRIATTRTLVTALQRCERAEIALVSASGVGFYGDRGDAELTEANPPGAGFPAEVCRQWEAGAREAEAAGVRVCCLRFGVVLGREGALARMLPVFRLGLGGPIGSGRQWMSWISLADAAGVIEQAVRDRAYAGAVNVVAPEPVRNRDFARALGRALHRPAVLPVPALMLRAAFGVMADEMILASTRAVPARLTALGYAFRHPRLDAALTDVLAPEVR